MKLGPLLTAICAGAVLGTGSFAADFNASFFGEKPGTPFEISPEVGDHQESWSRQHGEHASDAIEAPVENPVYERGSTGVERDKQWENFDESVRAGQAAHAPWPIREREAEPRVQRWPGVLRGPKEEPAVSAEKEDLRDAPAALHGNPSAVSLWSGLSQPMMLPANKVDNASSLQARELGRIDYENKILGAGIGNDGAVAGSESETLGAERKGMRAVVVLLDLSDSPGDIWPVLRSLPAENLKIDSKEKPEYLGATRSRALIRGWVPAGRSAFLLRSEKILRVETSRKKKAPTGFGREPETKLLIGVRIPVEVSPNAAVRSALRRLGKTAGFRFDKALAYQQIPGSSQLAIVVSGSVPIGNIERVMKDPAIVKVMPAPKPRKPAPVKAKTPPNQKLASFLIDENPTFLPVLLIGGWLLLQAASSKRRRGIRL